ncbi:hypothetical protein SDC9_82180 [bioreactor metagenome]|uniref:Uncharacterized protein n=1 Tax=bioreactor metagenome TaxID=1076179 RepID=A0A644Z4P2_9ZZZZ
MQHGKRNFFFIDQRIHALAGGVRAVILVTHEHRLHAGAERILNLNRFLLRLSAVGRQVDDRKILALEKRKQTAEVVRFVARVRAKQHRFHAGLLRGHDAEGLRRRCGVIYP